MAKASIVEYLQQQKGPKSQQQQQQPSSSSGQKGAEYSEVDIMASEHQKWREVYDFDVPVLHFDRGLKPDETTTIYSAKKKLFHRFTTEEVRNAVDEVDKAQGEERNS